jgi:tetratricopeptide (TPR) repeat protein
VVVENLEFVDQESLEVLKWWSFQQAEFPIFGLVSGRPGPRVQQLTRDSNIQALQLGEFDERARADFILQRFEDPDEARSLSDSILASTGGHPLFIEEMLATLVNRGVVTWNESGRKLSVHDPDAPLELPPSIEQALMNRLDELEPAHRDVLVGAAILGRTFRVDEVEILMERGVLDGLEDAFDRGFLERDDSSSAPSFTFSTISFHEICKSRLQDLRSRELHRRAAELKLHRADYVDGRDDGAIADHLVAAGSNVEAVEPSLRAANHALRMAGNVEAHYYLTLALGGMTPRDPRRFDALLERERVLRAWGRRRPQGADIRELISIAERLETPALEVRAAIRLLRFYLECGRSSRAAMLAPRIEERIELLEHPAPYLAALRELQSELSFSEGELELATDYARDGLHICESHALDAPQRCRLIACIGKIHAARGRLATARDAFQSMLELARDAGIPRLEAEALNSLGGVAGRSTDYQAAVDFFRSSIAIDRDLGDRATTGVKLANLGITFAAIGLYRRSERYLRKALELHEISGHAGLLNDAVIHLGEVVGELHDLEGAEAILDEAAKVAHELGDVRSELRAKNRRAKIILHRGVPERFSEAAALANEVYQRASRRGRPLRSAACRSLQVLAAIREHGGHHGEAIRLAREATILVRAGAAPVDGVLAIHHLGVLLTRAGRTEEGARLLSEAGRAVMRRLESLTDPLLREGYLGQAAVGRVLDDAGFSAPE